MLFLTVVFCAALKLGVQATWCFRATQAALNAASAQEVTGKVDYVEPDPENFFLAGTNAVEELDNMNDTINEPQHGVNESTASGRAMHGEAVDEPQNGVNATTASGEAISVRLNAHRWPLFDWRHRQVRFINRSTARLLVVTFARGDTAKMYNTEKVVREQTGSAPLGLAAAIQLMSPFAHAIFTLDESCKKIQDVPRGAEGLYFLWYAVDGDDLHFAGRLFTQCKRNVKFIGLGCATGKLRENVGGPRQSVCNSH